MSAINEFCMKCNEFEKRYCDGNRNTCVRILFEQIEVLQQENKQLRAKLDDWKYEVQCHIDEVVAKDKELEQLRAQTAKMKEALEYLRDLLPEFGGMDGRVWLTIDEALECEYMGGGQRG